MRVIAGNMESAGPARSPDEAPCDYFRRVRRAVRDVRPRDEMCIKMGGVPAEEIQKGND